MKIVVGGAQRSGTSYLRSILGSHSEIAFFPYDLRLWTKYWSAIGPGPISVRLQKGLIEDILRDEKTLISDDVPSFDEVWELLAESPQEGKITTAFEVFDSFLTAYATTRGRPIWGLKTPWNEFYASRILDHWSDAFFIHLVRNPLQSALSAKWAEGGTWFYDPFLHIDRWRKSAKLAMENAGLYASRYLVLRYEDLNSEPREVSQTLCSFLGLQYEEGMETGLRQPGWGGNNSSFNTSSAVASRYQERSLPKYLENLYIKELGSVMQSFGYPMTYVKTRASLLQFVAVRGHRLWLVALYRAMSVKKKLRELSRPGKPAHS